MSDKTPVHVTEVVVASERATLDAKSYDFTYTAIAHITPEAGRTMESVAEKQFAIPAQEKTKQEQEATKRVEIPAKEETKRYWAASGAVLLGIAAICWKPEAGWPIATALAVLAGPEIVSRIKKKPA